MMLHGHCCRCDTDNPFPGGECSTNIRRYYTCEPTPLASIQVSDPVHDPTTEWERYTPPGDTERWGSLVKVGLGGGAFSTQLMAPMRWISDYPDSNGDIWERHSIGLNLAKILEEENQMGRDDLFWEGGMMSGYGKFGGSTHLIPGQDISTDKLPYGTGRSFVFTGMDTLIPYNNPGQTLKTRIRYIRPIFNFTDVGITYDVIPSEYVNDWFGIDEFASADSRTYPHPLASSIEFGNWEWSLDGFPWIDNNILGFDIWHELHGSLTFSGYMTQTDLSFLTFQLVSNPGFDSSEDDYELTFLGNDAPTDGSETFKFTDLASPTIAPCYCDGIATWPAPFDSTTLQVTFSWDQEIPVIRVESLNPDEEFEGKGIVSYVPVQAIGSGTFPMELIGEWHDQADNRYWRRQRTGGNWAGGAGPQTFVRAFDIQFSATQTWSDLTSDTWPTQVTVTRTTQ